MIVDILPKICDPVTHDTLKMKSEPDAHGHIQEFLLNPKTSQVFPVREGIPIFLNEGEVSGNNQRYQSLYNRMAPFYDASTWIYSHWKGMKVETRLREYLDELEVVPTSQVLEVSVGTGRNLQFLPRDANYVGLDISWGMLRQARRNATKWGRDLGLVMGNAELLPFQDETFDVVFHFGGINFFNDKAAALREMIRVARPGTKFVVGDENESLAAKYAKVPVTDQFYQHQDSITAPVSLLPPGMQEIKVKDNAGGDLYCMTFRKPE